MLFNGTKSELARLTAKHMSAPWWPKQLDWSPAGGVWTIGNIDMARSYQAYVTVETAAAIIFAAATEALVAKGAVPLLGKPDAYNCSTLATMGSRTYGRTNHFGSSPLEAVLLALEGGEAS